MTRGHTFERRHGGARRRALLSLGAASLVATVTVAQHPGDPGVAELAERVTLTGIVEHSSEDACSQSFASSQGRAVFSLELRRAHRAKLVVTTSSVDVFGPALDFGDEGEVTRISESARVTLEGSIRRSSAAWTLRFVRSAGSHVRFSGFGTLPLPAPTSRSVDLTAHCVLERVALYPARPAAGEVGTDTPLLRCDLEGTVPHLERFDVSVVHFSSRPSGSRPSRRSRGRLPRRTFSAERRVLRSGQRRVLHVSGSARRTSVGTETRLPPGTPSRALGIGTPSGRAGVQAFLAS